MNIYDTTKTCCGPFCTDCQIIMEEADRELFHLRTSHAQLLEACKKANTCASIDSSVRELIRLAIKEATP